MDSLPVAGADLRGRLAADINAGNLLINERPQA